MFGFCYFLYKFLLKINFLDFVCLFHIHAVHIYSALLEEKGLANLENLLNLLNLIADSIISVLVWKNHSKCYHGVLF